MKGLAKGLVYLHEYSPKKYVHGDLKPSNVLLGHDMEPKISDFGLGHLANIAGAHSPNRAVLEKRHHRQQSSTSSEIVQTIACSNYQAPEVLKAMKPPSQKWDVYSYGIILVEMITGRSPNVQLGNSEMELVQWMQLCIQEKRPLSDILDSYLIQDVDKEDEKKEEVMAVLKIAMPCVQSSPDRRPSMRNVADALETLGLKNHT